MSEADHYQRLVELARKVSALESKVDFMLKELKLEYKPPDAPEPDEIQKLLKAGKKIQAIQLYMQQHKVGLADAKAAVEWIEMGFFR